jgi:hypothetical protein
VKRKREGKADEDMERATTSVHVMLHQSNILAEELSVIIKYSVSIHIL